MNRRELLAAGATGALALAVDTRAFAARLGGAAVALVTADLESHLVVVDLGTGRTLARIRTAPGPRSIEARHWRGGTAVIAHTEHGLVSIVDAISHRIREDDSFAAPRYTAVHPRLSIAYITDSAREEVVALDLERGEVVWRTGVPGPARHVSISRDGSTIWTALGTTAERVAVLDSSSPRRPRLARTIAPPFLAHDVVFAPDGRHVWVTSGDERRIAVYRAGSRRPVRILDADAPPQHVTCARDKVFVASGDEGTVRRHRLDGDLVRAARVPVGSYNVTFAFGHVVTPSLGNGTVAVLDRNGRLRDIRRIARAAHDACIVLVP
jgi:DNA-binding beta-propeller fold protein YncE